MTLVKNAPEPELGAAFINHMLQPSVLEMLSSRTYGAPSVEGITFRSSPTFGIKGISFSSSSALGIKRIALGSPAASRSDAANRHVALFSQSCHCPGSASANTSSSHTESVEKPSA